MKIDIPEEAAYIIDTLIQNGYEAYVVGGCVRDAILGRVPGDWDITTSAKPEEVKGLFKRTIDTGIQHGTVTIMIGKEGYEVTTYRIDGEYEDNRHPKQVEFTANLIEDLKRRDFTINAMAYNPQEGLVDEFDGIGDLRRQIIRCVGDANERFDEDALRMLRAVRFAGQLGFSIEEKTKEAIRKKAKHLQDISAERIRVELDKLLVSKQPEMLEEAYELGITAVVLPEFDKMLKTAQNNPHHIYNVGQHCIQAVKSINRVYTEQMECDKKMQSVLAWTMLLHDVGKTVCKTTDEKGIDHFYGHPQVSKEMAGKIIRRLKFDNYTLERVKRLVYYHDYRFTLTDKAMRRAAYKIGTDMMPYIFLVEQADVMAQSSDGQAEKLEIIRKAHEIYQAIREREECLSLKDLKVSGKDLIDAGIKPGKKMGDILQYLLERVLEHPEWNEKEKLLHMVQEWKE